MPVMSKVCASLNRSESEQCNCIYAKSFHELHATYNRR